MQNDQKEHWLTVYNWLRQCGSNLNESFCRDEITTHPDYPSLLSAVDFLNSGGMAYQAVKADASYINEFNYPLLAHIKEPGNEYMRIIPNATTWGQEKELAKHWSGITVYPEKNATWQSSENNRFQQAAKRNKFTAIILMLFGLGFYFYALYFGLAHSMFSTIAIPFFGFGSFAGLVISIYALSTELGFQSKVVKQVCGAVGGSSGCEQVLKSRYAKGLAGITPADASVLYFASQFIMYLSGCWQPVFFPTILFLSFGGIFISAWSIYTQAAKLRQWCTLCLGIVAVLVLQAGIASIIITESPFRASLLVQRNSIFNVACLFTILFVVLTLILLPIKQLIKANTANKQKLAELKKWKLDADLFINQWQQEQNVDTTVWENDLLLGVPNAPLIIIVACNPYCGPCAKAHKQLDELLHRFNGKLKVLVRFLTPPKLGDDKMSMAVSAILQKAATTKSNGELEEILADWFAWMDYNKWTEKWKPNLSLDVNVMLTKHNLWTDQSSIAFTPTFFLNGKKIPGRYSLDDVAWLIPQLAEIIK